METSPYHHGVNLVNPSYLPTLLIVAITSVLLCLYLVNIEVTIVSISLVTITNDLHGFDQTSWIVTGYLITYTGME